MVVSSPGVVEGCAEGWRVGAVVFFGWVAVSESLGEGAEAEEEDCCEEGAREHRGGFVVVLGVKVVLVLDICYLV